MLLKNKLFAIATFLLLFTAFSATAQNKKPLHIPSGGEGGTGRLVPQQDDGQVILHARDSSITGKLLRFEPQPHKNTVGYWANANDFVHWKCNITKPGLFIIEVLQGCGTGQGGSIIEVSIADTTRKMIVRDTGHFQNFVTRHLGVVNIEFEGDYQLTIKALKKAKGAVMDVRQVRLIPIKKGPYPDASWGQSWSVDEYVYLTIDSRPENGIIELPATDRHITHAYMLRENKKRIPLTFDVKKNILIYLPKELPALSGTAILALEVRNAKKANQAKDGSIELPATAAKIHGKRAQLESNPGNYRIGYWSNPKDTLSWEVDVKFPGEYNVEVVSAAGASKPTTYTLNIANQPLTVKVPLTKSYYKYTFRVIGKVTIKKKGKQTFTLTPKTFGGGAVMNLKLVLLRPVVE